MCDCTSCTYTDSFAGWGLNAEKGGFANWPRGEMKGPRKSAAEYASHAAHVWAGVAKTVPFKPGQAPQVSGMDARQWPHSAGPEKYVIDWINREHNRFDVGPVKKPTPYLLALARQLRKAA